MNIILKNALWKKISFLLFVVYTGTASAQHFEWAASAGNIDIRYSFSSTDARNNIIVGGEASVNYTHHGMPVLYNSIGDSISLYGERSEIVVCYSPEGKILWHWQMDHRYNVLCGISHDEHGNTVLLLDVKGESNDEHGNETGYFPESGEPSAIPAGYYLVYIDLNGNFKSKKKIFKGETTRLSISSFLAYPNGGFLLAGFAHPGKLCDELKDSAGPGGGNFLLALDKEGKPDWADIVSYAAQSCYSYLSDMCKAAVAPDGTVYFGGTYFEGGTFGGAKTILSPKSPEDNQYNKPYETYIASYSPRGKLNWVKTSVDRVQFQSIGAHNEGAVIGMALTTKASVFGQKADTSGHKLMVLVGLDKKGNISWKSSSTADRAQEICIDKQNHIYVLGTLNEVGRARHYGITGVIGSDTLQENTRVFIARFNSKGIYEWVKEAEIPITTTNEPLLLNMDNCGNLFVSGTIWFTFSASLSLFDNAFLRGKVYGPAPFISRFKNTIPERIVQSHGPDSVLTTDNPKTERRGESCIISPGPWKIRNYPNPFSSATTFEYLISYQDFVTLELFDMNGKLIQTLFEGKKHDPGKFTFAFNKQIAAGTYIASLKGTETIATCRIVVNK